MAALRALWAVCVNCASTVLAVAVRTIASRMPTNLLLLHLVKGFKDVWSGEIMRFEGPVSFTLPPHGSRLLAVCESDAVQLLDANIRILHSEREGNALYLFFDYANEAEFTFASKPIRVTVNGTPIKVTGTTLKTAIGKSSMMIAEFA